MRKNPVLTNRLFAASREDIQHELLKGSIQRYYFTLKSKLYARP